MLIPHDTIFSVSPRFEALLPPGGLDGVTLDLRALDVPTVLEGRAGDVALVSVLGVLAKERTIWLAANGGTSYRDLVAAIDRAARSSARAIVLDVRSPGGGIFAMPEAVRAVLRARRRKPVLAWVSRAAGPAVALAAACSRVYARPLATFGPIGIVGTADIDEAALLQMRGDLAQVVADVRGLDLVRSACDLAYLGRRAVFSETAETMGLCDHIYDSLEEVIEETRRC